MVVATNSTCTTLVPRGHKQYMYLLAVKASMEGAENFVGLYFFCDVTFFCNHYTKVVYTNSIDYY